MHILSSVKECQLWIFDILQHQKSVDQLHPPGFCVPPRSTRIFRDYANVVHVQCVMTPFSYYGLSDMHNRAHTKLTTKQYPMSRGR